jgi:hypothetical protein
MTPDDAPPPEQTLAPPRRWNALDMQARFAGLTRRQELLELVRPGGIGIELGVAKGRFSALICRRGRLAHLYSVDMYAGRQAHNIEEYREAIRTLDPWRDRNTLLRMRFDEALPLFPDGFFDFVYVDGFAHTGEEEGRTIRDWFQKVAPGGIFAGHDYDPNWPKVVAQVDAFVADHPGLPLFTVGGEAPDPEDRYNRFRSWFTVRPG